MICSIRGNADNLTLFFSASQSAPSMPSLLMPVSGPRWVYDSRRFLVRFQTFFINVSRLTSFQQYLQANTSNVSRLTTHHKLDFLMSRSWETVSWGENCQKKRKFIKPSSACQMQQIILFFKTQHQLRPVLFDSWAGVSRCEIKTAFLSYGPLLNVALGHAELKQVKCIVVSHHSWLVDKVRF